MVNPPAMSATQLLPSEGDESSSPLPNSPMPTRCPISPTPPPSLRTCPTSNGPTMAPPGKPRPSYPGRTGIAATERAKGINSRHLPSPYSQHFTSGEASIIRWFRSASWLSGSILPSCSRQRMCPRPANDSPIVSGGAFTYGCGTLQNLSDYCY